MGYKTRLETNCRTIPATVEELVDFVIVGNEAVQSFKAKLRACTKAESAKGARNTALNDGRKVSHLVFEAEYRLGELLEQIETIYVGSIKGTHEKPSKGIPPKQLPSLPFGINKKESFYAQEIHRNPEIVEQV